MKNIQLLRIDNRLVHGQVGLIWVSSVGANMIVVVDDLVAKDNVQQQLMSLTAQSSGVQIRFFSVQQAISTIPKASPQQKLFIVCRTPVEARQLIEGGLEISKINVGNMHFSEGKRQLSKRVFVDDKDMEDLTFLKNTGVDITIQDVPTSTKENI